MRGIERICLTGLLFTVMLLLFTPLTAADQDLGQAVVLASDGYRLEGSVVVRTERLHLDRVGDQPIQIRFNQVHILELQEVKKATVGGKSVKAAFYSMKAVNTDKPIVGYVPLDRRIFFRMNSNRGVKNLEIGPQNPVRKITFQENMRRYLSSKKSLGQVQAAGETKELVVPGNTSWLRTGIYLQKDQKVRITVSGAIKWGTDPTGKDCGPDGVPHAGRKNRPLPERHLGMLIARIRTQPDKAYGIGSEKGFKTPVAGELEFGINDDDLKDNTGNFRVRMVIEAR